MSNSHRFALTLSLFMALNVMAADQVCPAPGALAGVSTVEQSNQECPKPVKPCEKDSDTGVMAWVLGSHRMPTLHFIDLVEMFLR